MFVRLPMQTSSSPHSTQRLASRPVFLPCTPRQPVPERARCSTLSRSFQSDAIGSHDQSRWWPSEETPFRQPRQQQFLQQQFPQQAPQQQTETEFLWAGNRSDYLVHGQQCRSCICLVSATADIPTNSKGANQGLHWLPACACTCGWCSCLVITA